MLSFIKNNLVEHEFYIFVAVFKVLVKFVKYYAYGSFYKK